jgi:hypothetical protein
MAQSGEGKIRLFNDFFGVAEVLAGTGDPVTSGGAQLGDFFAGGEGFEDNDAGVAGKDALSGVITITSGDSDADTTFIGTHIGLDVGLMGPIVLEARVQLPDLDTKEIFFGLTSILSVDEQLEDIVINASSTTLTAPAELVGFYLSDELGDDEDWHGIHNKTAGATLTTTSVDLDADAQSGEWQVLRLEVDNNGTARWYIDGDLKQTVVAAVSTSTDFAVCLAGAANGGTQLVIFDVDYLLVQANRDWTV